MVEVAPVAVLVETRHDVDPAGHADRRGVVVVIKGHARLGQAVDMRCLHVLIAVAPQRVARLVVGEEEDNVGLVRGVKSHTGREQTKQGVDEVLGRIHFSMQISSLTGRIITCPSANHGLALLSDTRAKYRLKKARRAQQRLLAIEILFSVYITCSLFCYFPLYKWF